MRYGILLGLFLSLAMPAFAQTLVPAAAVNQMTPDNIAKNGMALSPEMRQQLMDKFQNMTPQQKQALTDQAKDAWQKLPQDKKDMIKEKAIEQYQSLTPQQKQSIQDQAMQKWQSISPQDKQQLATQFKGLLQGDALGNAAK
jgi:hypothetical protein